MAPHDLPPLVTAYGKDNGRHTVYGRVKGFYRHNGCPKSADFKLIKRKTILGVCDIISGSALKGVIAFPKVTDALLMLAKEQTVILCKGSHGRKIQVLKEPSWLSANKQTTLVL